MTSDGLVGHRRRLAERDHVRGSDVVREAAQQRVARAAEDLADEIPDREIDRAARDVVARHRSTALGDELDAQRVDTRRAPR